MNPEELISCAMDIGEQMLLSGAEVDRVETTVNRRAHPEFFGNGDNLYLCGDLCTD